MLAYKFRAASQIQFVFDILLNRRLYCSEWKNLNDPMEGSFVSVNRQNGAVRVAVAELREAKRPYKICSLSSTFDCHLLWAHYAGGFDGVAIEVELPDDDPMVRRVDYRGVFAVVELDRYHDPDEAARSILLSKYREWSYEREIRILSWESYYQLSGPVRKVIAGSRMDPALFDALHLICDKLGIEFRRVGIGDEGIDADRVGPPKLKYYRKKSNGADRGLVKAL